MTARAKQVLSEALSLPPSERAQLAERLFSSLDVSQKELYSLWAKEADSRIDAYDRGDIKAVSANDVYKKTYRQWYKVPVSICPCDLIFDFLHCLRGTRHLDRLRGVFPGNALIKNANRFHVLVDIAGRMKNGI